MRKNRWLRRGVYLLVVLVILYVAFWIALFNPLEGSVPLLQAMIPGNDEVARGVTYCVHGPWEEIRKSPLFVKHYLESPARSDFERETGLDETLIRPIREVEEQINATLPSFLGRFSVLEDLAGREILVAGYLDGPGDELADRVLNSPFVMLTRISFKAKFLEALKFEFVRSKVPGLRKRRNYYEYDLVEGAGLDRPEEDRYRFFTRIKDVLIVSNNAELIENVIRLGYAGGISEDCLAQQFYYYWDFRSPSPENALTCWMRVSKADAELGYVLGGVREEQEGGLADILRTLFPVRRTVSTLVRLGTDGEDRIPLTGVVRMLENLKGEEYIEGLHREKAVPLREPAGKCAAMIPARGTFLYSWLKMEAPDFFKAFFLSLDEGTRLLLFRDAALPPGEDAGKWDLDTMARRLGDWFEEGVAVAAARLPEADSIDLDRWEGGVPKPLPALTLCLSIRPELDSALLIDWFEENSERFGWEKPVAVKSPVGKVYELPLKADRSLALLKPAIGLLDHQFLFSTNMGELERALALGKEDGESLAKRPEFEAALSSVAKKGNLFVYVDGDRLMPFLQDRRHQVAFDATFFDRREFRKRAIIEMTEEHEDWTNEQIQAEADRRVEERTFTMKRTDFPEAVDRYRKGLRFCEPLRWLAISTTSSGDTGGPRLDLKGAIQLRPVNGGGEAE